MDWKPQMRSGLDYWIQLCSKERQYFSIKEQLIELREDIEDELTVIVAGEFNAGKSTFINALLEKKILTSDVTPETAMVTKLTYGKKRKVIAHYLDGHTKVYDDAWLEQLTAERDGEFKDIRRQLSCVELQIPAEILKELTIIDTPGLNANNEHHTEATERFLGRADHAIFLFQALYVGNATELKWLKKFNDHGITPVGIINRIDELNDDELEEVIEYNQPRLGPAVSRLFGVSALDALDGKLQQNEELLHWSRWEEVEKQLESFKEQSNRKIERAYTRLIEPIKQMDQLYLERKLSLPLKKLDSHKIERFVARDFPELLSIKEQLEYCRKMTGTVSDSWHRILNPVIDSMDSVDRFLRRFMEQYRKMGSRTVLNKDPLQEWEGMVLNEYDPFSANRKEYNLKAAKWSGEREKLEGNWKDIYYSGLLMKRRRLEKHRKKLDFFNEEQKQLEGKHRELTSLFSGMNVKVNELENRMESFIENDINSYAEQEQLALKSWNRQLEEAKKSFADFSQEKMNRIEDFSQILREFHENIAGPILAAGKTAENFLAYAEVSYLFGNMANLKQGLPPEDFYAKWRMLDVFSKEKAKQYDVHFPKLMPPELVYHELKVPPVKLKHNVEAEINHIIFHRNKWVKRGAGMAVILLLVTGALWINRIYEDENDSAVLNDYQTDEANIDDAEATDEGQLLEEEKQRMAEQFPSEDIESFLQSVHPQLNYDSYSYQDLFVENGWAAFQPFYEEIAQEEQVSLAVAAIEYVSGDEIRVDVKETYGTEGVQKEFDTHYTLRSSNSNDNLMVSAFSYELAGETETEIALADGHLADFLGDFRSAYMTALNEGSTSYINSFIDAQSPVRDQIQTYMDSIAGKGWQFEELGFQINRVTKAGINTYRVMTNEKFMRLDDQQEKTRNERSKEYIVDVLPEKGPVIMNITTTDQNTEVISEPTVQLVSQQTVSDFIGRYYSALEMAFNGNGFSFVQSYYDHHASIYESTEKYIMNANSKSMHMNNLEMNIESIIQADEHHYLATVLLTDEYFYRDGTGDHKKVRAQYKVRVTNTGDLLISENPPVEILEEIEL